MAKRRRKSTRKNPKRVRAARRAYKKSGLYKYNLRRKRKGHGKRRKKYAGKRKKSRRHGRKRRHSRKSRRHSKRRARRSSKRRSRKYARKHRRHGRRKKKYKRLSKAEARAARIARKLARSKNVAVVPKSKLTPHQKSYLDKLRARAAAHRVMPEHAWAS